MFGYFSEFWDAVSDVGSTTAAWFQGVGNAVAGAVGSLIYPILHFINDFFVFFGYIAEILKEFVLILVQPFSFFYNFLTHFISASFADPTMQTFSWDSGVLALFNSIPLWSSLVAVLAACFALIVAGSLIWLLTKI